MEDIEKTPLGEFRAKAKRVTYIAAACAILLALITAGLSADAQSKYASYLSNYSSLYSSLSSISLEEYQAAKAGADFCLFATAACGCVTSFSILAWIGANLHIASKRTQLGVTETAAVSPTPERQSSSPVPPADLEGEPMKPEDELSSEADANV